jgi:hypothetical protein
MFSASPIIARLNERVKDYGDKDLSARLLAHRFVERACYANNSLSSDTNVIYPPSPYVFIYWAQGFKYAPSIVRACLHRLHALNSSMQIVELDDGNFKDWVSIPKYILNNPNINKTHFSDILRCALLAEYGGIWIDATCYCSQPLELLVAEVGERFFAYSRQDHSLLSSWFLISRRNNIIPVLMRDFIYSYYERNTYIPHYFFFHYLFEALYHAYPSFKIEWDARFLQSSDSAHVLQGVLSAPYEVNLFETILKLTHVQKLSYKLTKMPRHDSFYFSLCKNELPDEEIKFVNYRDLSRLKRRAKRLIVVTSIIAVLYIAAIFL